ncbi:splicing factor, arginine/serine-rich 1/9 [Angomonas deanei]|uniref:RNA recognition motif. (A.k.a. RRM, RBD, or RNP domain), putative n=1 Tax=Angomonas deanei TaxID=59799 RepID=A0A7G2CDC8_9TRYP|nr:splicing factor, arginine/serine-rich 1/9 [Angomonas deanei]CAD2217840.1 RNA recognition motif. (a.k.a. RRM, RBD, or RNP domain), putative [Angomonas deanei]|eukprot:EPY35490.1 splicing factor, arginine/serine-rich 1/9 [Angomonas deanei]
MRKSYGRFFSLTVSRFQGWGDHSGSGQQGGGWNSSGWANGGGGGGWGSADQATQPEGGKGGWGDFSSGNKGQSGWGDGGNWSGNDGGWKSSNSGRSNRGNFKGRQSRGDGWGSNGGAWGEPAAVDDVAWSSAPPSFSPPVRRVDPLTLTAAEVTIDGVKKLVGQRVQITGLSDSTSWQTLKDHLRQAGEVVFCRRFSNGRGMVEFSTPEDAARAITELQASELEGATLFLREDREDTVLNNTRRRIREAREEKLRKRKEEAEKRGWKPQSQKGTNPDLNHLTTLCTD